MEQNTAIALLRENFKIIEKKHEDFFKKGAPRWPGEKQDYLRNHHKNLDGLSMRNLTFDRLGLSNLPDPILQDLQHAFEAFQNGQRYQ